MSDSPELKTFREANPNLKFVSVVFAPYRGKNTYDYATNFDVKSGDYVVVDTPSNGYQLTFVKAVIGIGAAKFSSHYDHKFVVAVVEANDLLGYQEARTMEQAKIKQLKKIMLANDTKAAKRL